MNVCLQSELDCVVPGEELKVLFPDVKIKLKGAQTDAAPGTIFVTNFQLIFTKTVDQNVCQF